MTSLTPSSLTPSGIESEKVNEEIREEIKVAREVEESYARSQVPDEDVNLASPPPGSKTSPVVPSQRITCAFKNPSANLTYVRRKPRTLITLKRGNLPDNVEIKRLVKNQLKLLKKLQQRHHAEQEDLAKAHVLLRFLT